MTSRRSLASLLWLIALLLAAVIAACTDDVKQSGISVPRSWQVTRAVSGHRSHVLLKGIPCNKCHGMSETQLGKVEPARCAACHEQQATIHHASAQAAQRFGASAHADCTSCHAFTLEGSGHEAALHALAEPRGQGAGGRGGRAEPPLVATFSPGDCKRCHATAQGELPAVQAHGTQDCLSCHRPHADQTPKSAPCSDCHKDISTAHASHGKSVTETCSTCHQHQHAAAVDARSTCVDCHASHEPIVPQSALFAGGHRECVGCHRPHEFQAEQATNCRTCHQDQTVLGAGRVAAHEQCTSCHAPHDVKNAPGQACVKCHADVHPDHPELGKNGGCVSCHDPHPHGEHRQESARSCSNCHQFAGSDHASHGGVDCVRCHKPHEFGIELGTTSVCRDCHAEHVQQVGLNRGHQACNGCHAGLPHRPEALRAGCETCHTSEHARVLSGHANCTSCHEPHSGAQAAPCRSCHQQEHVTAPTGHRECTSCHEPHGGRPTVKSCAQCHASEAQSAHGQSATGCLGCHRPHGPQGMAKPPACATCHRPDALPGLHREQKHQTCERCHTGHGDARGLERQVCLACHRDRETHFPDAPRCANCHLFTPSH